MIDRKPYKKCTICGEYKPVDEFYYYTKIKRGKAYNGYDSYCKTCRLQYQREYVEKRKNNERNNPV